MGQFTNVKQNFLDKKKDVIQKVNWILLKTKTTNFVVEERLLAVMVENGRDLRYTSRVGYTKPLGWHIGNDGKVYERIKLNDYGEIYYDLNKQNLDKFIEVAHDIIDGNRNLGNVYYYIKFNKFFENADILSMNKYDGAELQTNKEKEIER